MAIGGHRPPPEAWTKKRVEAGRKVAKKTVKKEEAARRRAGADMAGFRDLAGVAEDRKRVRHQAMVAATPFVKRLADQVGTSKVAAGAGGSSYARIVKAFQTYWSMLIRADVPAQSEALAVLSGMVPLWLNDPAHRAQDPQTTARRQVLQDLTDMVAVQQAALARQEGQERYLAAASAGSTLHSAEGQGPTVPESYAGRFEKITGGARVQATDALHGYKMRAGTATFGGEAATRHAAFTESREMHGLTGAETTALTAYTDANYFVINPALANSKSWMKSTMASKEVTEELKPAPDKRKDPTALRDLMREGSAQGAVAMQALAKLPQFEGETYRAQARKLSEEASLRLVAGAVHTMTALTSTAKVVEATGPFAGKAGKDDVMILWVYKDVGKDIEPYSMIATEREVLAGIGERVRIVSVTQVDPAKPAWMNKDAVARYAHKFTKRAGKVLVVRAEAVGAGAVAAPAAAAAPARGGWQRAKAGGQ